MRLFAALIAIVVLAAGTVNANERQPRVVFNDDAQMLMETPPTGATEFVKQWLDKEAAAIPFSTYVFLPTCFLLPHRTSVLMIRTPVKHTAIASAKAIRTAGQPAFEIYVRKGPIF